MATNQGYFPDEVLSHMRQNLVDARFFFIGWTAGNSPVK